MDGTALERLRKAYEQCQRCGLAETRARVVFGDGKPQAPTFWHVDSSYDAVAFGGSVRTYYKG